MAVRIYFVGGESVIVQDETLRGLEERLSGDEVRSGTVRYPNENLLVVLDKVTHVREG